MEYDFLANLFNYRPEYNYTPEYNDREERREIKFDIDSEYPDVSLIKSIVRSERDDGDINYIENVGDVNYIEKYLIDGGDPNKIFYMMGSCNQRGEDDISILMLAVLNKRTSIVNLLIRNGADVNYRSKCYDYIIGLSAINIAAESDPRIGRTTRQRAKSGDNYDIMIALLKAGANPNNITQDGYQKTPLMNALKYFTPKKYELLLEYGADPNLNAPLLHTISLDPSKAIIASKLLLLYGADIDVVTWQGNGVLYSAALEYMPNAMLFLLEWGADPYIKNNYGENAIVKHNFDDSSSNLKRNIEVLIQEMDKLHKLNVAYQMLNIAEGIDEDPLQEITDDLLEEIYNDLISKEYNPLITRERIRENYEFKGGKKKKRKYKKLTKKGKDWVKLAQEDMINRTIGKKKKKKTLKKKRKINL